MSPKRKANTEAPKTSTKDILQNWNDFYIKNDFGIGVQCTACNKWRLTYQYQETSEVPSDWTCSMWKINEKETGCCSMPSDKTEDDFALEEYTPGSLVWAKSKGFSWWPAMVEDSPDEQEYYQAGEKNEEDTYHVTFFGAKPYRSWVQCSKIRRFDNPPEGKKQFKRSPGFKKATKEAEEAAKASLKERLRNYSFAVRYSGKWGRVVDKDDVSLPPVVACSERKSRSKKCEETKSQIVGQGPSAQSSHDLKSTVDDNVGQKPKSPQDIDNRSITRDLQCIPPSFIDQNMKNLSQYYQETEEEATARRMYEKHLFENYKPLFNPDGSIAT